MGLGLEGGRAIAFVAMWADGAAISASGYIGESRCLKMDTDEVDVDDLRLGEPIQMRCLHQELIIDVVECRSILGSCGYPYVMLVGELADRREPRRSEVGDGEVGAFQKGCADA